MQGLNVPPSSEISKKLKWKMTIAVLAGFLSAYGLLLLFAMVMNAILK